MNNNQEPSSIILKKICGLNYTYNVIAATKKPFFICNIAVLRSTGAAARRSSRTGAPPWERRPPARCTAQQAEAHCSCRANKPAPGCKPGAPRNTASAAAAVCASGAKSACKSASAGTDCSKCVMEWRFRARPAWSPGSGP